MKSSKAVPSAALEEFLSSVASTVPGDAMTLSLMTPKGHEVVAAIGAGVRGEVLARGSMSGLVMDMCFPLLIANRFTYPLKPSVLPGVECRMCAFLGVPIRCRANIAFGTLAMMSYRTREWTPLDLGQLLASAEILSSGILSRDMGA